MTKITAAMIALTGALALSACGFGEDSGDGPSSQEIADTYITQMNKVADALDQINSEEDIEAVAATIQAAGAELQVISDELGGSLTGMKAMKVIGSRAGDFMKTQQRLITSLSAAAQRNPEIMQQIKKEMEELPLQR